MLKSCEAFFVYASCTSLPSIALPKSLTSLSMSVFEGCTSLTSINIPDAVTTMGHACFMGCTALTTVTLGSSLNQIDDSAFNQCTSLTTVVCKAVNPPLCGSDVFTEVPTAEATLYVPAGSEDYYNGNNPWHYFGLIKSLDELPTGIEAVWAHDAGKVSPAYNLGGQRIAQPKKGIFIQNGKVRIAR